MFDIEKDANFKVTYHTKNGIFYRFDDDYYTITVGGDLKKIDRYIPCYDLIFENHREDGPAIIVENNWHSWSEESWIVDNKRHRLDGPAIIRCDEDGTTYEWWIDDDPIVDDVENWMKENNIDLLNMSDEDAVAFKLKFS